MATLAIYLKYLKLLPCSLHESDFVCVCTFLENARKCFMHLHFNEDVRFVFLLLSLSLFLSYFFSTLFLLLLLLVVEFFSFGRVRVQYSSSVCVCMCSAAILISYKVRCIHTWLLKIAHKFTQGYFVVAVFAICTIFPETSFECKI